MNIDEYFPLLNEIELATAISACKVGGAVNAANALNKHITRLTIEIERLKRGAFTPEEFQNLCHNLEGCTREEFQRGCTEYQRKLFGDNNQAESISQ